MTNRNNKAFVIILTFVLLFNMMIPLTGVFGDEGGLYEDEINIEDLTNQFVSGAVKKGDRFIWSPSSNADGHNFNFRVNYSTSGRGYMDPGDMVIEIPYHIVRNRAGEYADKAQMSLWKKADYEAEVENSGKKPNGVDLVYSVIEKAGKDYIKVENIKQLPAATNGYFEVAYGTTEHAMEYTDMGKSEDFNSHMYIDGKEKEANPIPVYIDRKSVV